MESVTVKEKSKWKKYFYILVAICVVLLSLLVGVIVGATGNEGKQKINAELSDTEQGNNERKFVIKTKEIHTAYSIVKNEYNSKGLLTLSTIENIDEEIQGENQIWDIQYEYDESIAKGYIDDVLVVFITFDDDGNKISEINYNSDGVKTSEAQYKNNKQIELITYTYLEGSLISKKTIRWNEYGDIIEQEDYYKYEEETYSKSTLEYEYDATGKKISAQGVRSGDDKTYSVYFEYVYDSNGEIIEEKWISEELCARKITYAYDGAGNIKEKKDVYFKNEDEVLFSYEYSYEYDKYGNILFEETVQNFNGQSSVISCYYTYYE